MKENIIFFLNLREISYLKKNYKFYCKNCKEELNHDLQIRKKTCSQLCYNMIHYNSFFESLNNLYSVNLNDYM